MQISESKPILIEIPLHHFSLVEWVDSMSLDSNGEELGGEGMILPLIVSKYFEVERFEQSHDAIYLEEVERRL